MGSEVAMRVPTAVLVCSTLFAGCEVNLNTEGLSAREVKTFTVTGQPELVLDTFDGAIEVHSWDRNEIEVEVEKRAMEQALLDEIKIDAQQNGDKVTVKVTGPPRGDRGGVTIGVHVSPTARLRVAVPRTLILSAHSGDGSIRAEALDGRIVLSTTDGSVVGSRLGGDIQIRSGDGSIRLDQITGKVDLETTDGSIGLEAKPTVLKARTGDGSIRARIEPGAVMDDSWELTTSDGTITVALPDDFSAELDVETSDGTVRADRSVFPDERGDESGNDGRDERRERRRTLRSKLGDGGKTFRIRSGDGSIRIER
jgi:putative adhesin